MATKMSKAMYGKTMMKKGGTKKLVKKGMGGPGSGMGRMAADDAAQTKFDAMIATPATKPMLDPVVEAKLAEASAAAARRSALQGQTMSGAMNASMAPIKKNGGATKTTYKTGGMVNANAKLVAAKSAGSKGVKVKVNPKATASNTAKKPSKPRSKAPKKAVPKAKYGMTMMSGGSKKSC